MMDNRRTPATRKHLKMCLERLLLKYTFEEIASMTKRSVTWLKDLLND